MPNETELSSAISASGHRPISSSKLISPLGLADDPDASTKVNWNLIPTKKYGVNHILRLDVTHADTLMSRSLPPIQAGPSCCDLTNRWRPPRVGNAAMAIPPRPAEVSARPRSPPGLEASRRALSQACGRWLRAIVPLRPVKSSFSHCARTRALGRTAKAAKGVLLSAVGMSLRLGLSPLMLAGLFNGVKLAVATLRASIRQRRCLLRRKPAPYT
jgi:hypothetical protein